MKNALSIIAFLLIGVLSNAQSTFGEIRGKVFDENNQALIGANVFVRAGEQQIGAMTDIDGQFIIKPLKAGIYNLNISFIGYVSKEITSVRVDPDQITYVKNQSMEVATFMGPEIEIITYTVPLIDPEEASKITVTADMIKNSPAKRNIQAIVTTMTAGVSSSADGRELYFRGSRSNAVQYMVDGMKITGNFRSLPASGIGSISVYTGGVPAKYGDLTGGVIVIESKNYFDLYNEWIASQP